MPLVGLMPENSFFEAVQLNPRDPVATPIVAQMDELFAVDAEARRKMMRSFMRVPELHALERFSSLSVDRGPMRNSRVFASKWSSN
jgi:hypothetical protein